MIKEKEMEIVSTLNFNFGMSTIYDLVSVIIINL